MAAAVDMLETEIASAGPESLLVGWSMGVAVAWAWLERHGGVGVAGLVTVDMSPRPVNGGGWKLGLLGQTPERLRRNTAEIRRDWPAAAEKIATTIFAETAGASNFSRTDALAQVLSQDPVKMAAYWDEILALDLRSAARDVRTLWRVVLGARSRVYPEATARWLAKTSDAATRPLRPIGPLAASRGAGGFCRDAKPL